MKSAQDQTTAYPAARTAWFSVAILSLAYMFSVMDRSILYLLIEPIKKDLGISDTEIGLLTGFAFAFIYTVMGVPMGRFADLWVRKYVIIFGVSVWSIMTIFGGFSRNFVQLFITRMGVGFGEAALTPTAYAMLADMFPAEKLTRAVSIFVMGGMIGGGLALVFGGFIVSLVEKIGVLSLPVIGTLYAWQMVLIVMGILSLIMIIPLSFMKEPRKRISAAQKDAEKLPFKAVLSIIWQNKALYVPFISAMTIGQLYGIGSAVWVPTYFVRLYHWSIPETAVILGLLYFGPVLIGGLGSGWLSDHLFKKGYQGSALYIFMGLMILLIFTIPLFIYIPVMPIKFVFLSLSSMAVIGVNTLFPAIIQLSTRNDILAQVSSIHLLIVNLISYSLGPLCVGVLTDSLFGDEMALGHSLALVGVVAYGVAAIIIRFAFVPFTERVNLKLREQNDIST